jgi:hypothetical protein
MMFPPAALRHFIECTNIELLHADKEVMEYEEAIKFFGIIILATRFEFTARASLWSAARISRFHASPCFTASLVGKKLYYYLISAPAGTHTSSS